MCADGYALTFVGGQLMCVNSVENAQNATTASSAVTAGTAQQLDPNAQVNASQISGQISSQQMQTPTCGSGQVLTNTGSGLTCVASAGGSGGTTPCAAGAFTMSQTHYIYGSSRGVFGVRTSVLPSGNLNNVIPVYTSFAAIENGDGYGPYPEETVTTSWKCTASGWESQTAQPAGSSNSHPEISGGRGATYTWTPTLIPNS